MIGLMEDGTLNLDSKVAMVHELITLGLMHIKGLSERELRNALQREITAVEKERTQWLPDVA